MFFGLVGHITFQPIAVVARLALEPEQIRELHKQLFAIVDELVGIAHQLSSGHRRNYIQILQVAIVADIVRCPRIDLIGHEQISVEIFARFQRCLLLVCQQRVVLQDHPQRQFAIELPIQFRAAARS